MNDMIEKVRDAKTPAEMRAEIHRLRFYDPLVRMCMDIADVECLSSEDRYTLLAYNALRLSTHLKSQMLDYNMTHIAPPVILRPTGG